MTTANPPGADPRQSDSGRPVPEITDAQMDAIHGVSPVVAPKRDPYPWRVRDVFHVDGSWAVLEWPTTMTPEGYAEFRDWIAICLRKIERMSR